MWGGLNVIYLTDIVLYHVIVPVALMISQMRKQDIYLGFMRQELGLWYEGPPDTPVPQSTALPGEVTWDSPSPHFAGLPLRWVILTLTSVSPGTVCSMFTCDCS